MRQLAARLVDDARLAIEPGQGRVEFAAGEIAAEPPYRSRSGRFSVEPVDLQPPARRARGDRIDQRAAARMVEPGVVTARRPDRSVSSQPARMLDQRLPLVAGTSTVSVGLSPARAASVRLGARRRAWIVTVAPACSAGVVWMFEPADMEQRPAR